MEEKYSVLSGVVGYLDGSHEDGLRRISEFLKRHGVAVMEVMRDATAHKILDGFGLNSLPRLYGEIQSAQFIDRPEGGAIAASPLKKPVLLFVFTDREKKLMINDSVEITGAGFRLLRCLADANLEGAGSGLALEDYPMLKAENLSAKLGMSSAESLRKSVNRLWNVLKQRLASIGIDEDVIENIPWAGYRLNPDLVKVTLKTVS